jgi:radical SAM superfamily enzyme YgiQ (UPF0313 family)
LFEDLKEEQIMKPYPPLGLLYVSGYLNTMQVENHLFDSTFKSRDEQLDFIADRQPKTVAIYTNLMTKINVIRLIQILKIEERYGSPKIVLGGPDITYNVENYLKAGADYLVIGEGEETLYELYKALDSGECTDSIDGIAYLTNGKVVKTNARTKMKDLSELPLPHREGIDLTKYLEVWKEHHGKSSMTVSTQRGCPYTCKWCSTAVYGQSYRRRPAKMVVEEMAMLKNKYDPDTIWFVDDVFTVSHNWIREFHSEIMEQGILIPFECITRAERLNDGILQLLKEAGCYRIWIGAESGSQKIIDAMDRRVDVEVVQQAIQKANQLEIETGTFIMLGYPGEHEEDIQMTIDHLKRSNPTHYTITVAYPIKGTSLYSEIEGVIISKPDWESSTDRDIEFKRPYPRRFYDHAVRKVVNEVESAKATGIRKMKHQIKSRYSQFFMNYYKSRS